MPAFIAQQRCPRLTLVTLASSIITTACATVAAVLRQYGDAVVDVREACWHVTLHALGAHYEHALPLATELQRALRDVTGLWTNIALAAFPPVAQLIADSISVHTAAVRVVLPGTEAAAVAPLPIQYLPGVGPKTVVRFQHLGITTLGELAALPSTQLVRLFGPRGATWQHLAQGHAAPRTAVRAPTWTGTWHFGPHGCADALQVQQQVQRLTERVGRQVRAHQQAVGAITVTIRWMDGRTHTRTERLPQRAVFDRELAAASQCAVRQLLSQRRLAVQELTVCVDDLGPEQATLFATDARLRDQQQAMDQIKRRHGTSAIMFAWMLPPRPSS